MFRCKVLNYLPYSQNRAITLECGLQIPTVRSIYSSYDRSMEALKNKENVPRDFRKMYIPTWDHKRSELYDTFQNTNENSVADELKEY